MCARFRFLVAHRTVIDGCAASGQRSIRRCSTATTRFVRSGRVQVAESAPDVCTADCSSSPSVTRRASPRRRDWIQENIFTSEPGDLNPTNERTPARCRAASPPLTGLVRLAIERIAAELGVAPTRSVSWQRCASSSHLQERARRARAWRPVDADGRG
jgi:hypothetical protein